MRVCVPLWPQKVLFSLFRLLLSQMCNICLVKIKVPKRWTWSYLGLKARIGRTEKLVLNIFCVVVLGWHFSRIIRHLKLSRCNCLQKLYFCRLATLIRNDEMNVKIKITPGSCQVQDKFECLLLMSQDMNIADVFKSGVRTGNCRLEMNGNEIRKVNIQYSARPTLLEFESIISWPQAEDGIL